MRPFLISRTFDAPRSTLWKAWTDPNIFNQWWGPKGAQVRQAKIELHPGGTNHYCMAFDGSEMWGKQVYREIQEPERLVFVNSFSDENGGLTRHPMHSAWPLEIMTTVTFQDEGAKTTVKVEWLPIDPNEEEWKTFDENRASMQQGWGGSFDQLEEFLRR